MSRLFIISDTHFGHKGILGLQPHERPFKTIEEHDQDLVARWNSVVKPKDCVWHLGDVFFTKDGHLPLAACNGIKRLVLGNHDHFPIEVYQKYFSRIAGASEYRGCLMTHVPIHRNQLGRYRLNLHGHMHSGRVMRFGGLVSDRRYRCVSAEQSNLTPVLLESVL